MIMNKHRSTFPRGSMSRIRSLGASLRLDKHLVKDSIYRYEKLALHLVKHHGKSHASKHLKQLYNCLKMSALGCEIPNPSSWRATYPCGLPKVVIKVIKPLIITNDNHIRWLLSLFSLYETWKADKCLADLHTLTSPSTCVWNAEQLRNFNKGLRPIVRRMKSCKMIRPYRPSEPLDYLSLKGGPLGQATLSAHHDARSLLANPKVLRKLLRLHSDITGRSDSSPELLDEITNVSEMSKKYFKELPILKTLAIPDKGPKVRTITTGNYYLQRSLKEIHNLLMATLRNIPEDGTYKQDEAAMTVKSWTNQGIQPWCFDLTAATDRFPVLIQYVAIKNVYPEIAYSWYSLMRKATSYDKDRKKYFEFSVGQPMGLYTSWPAFALTHHLLVRYAFRQVDEAYDNQYYIIGDDIAIKSSKASAKYRELITSLGISISQDKSITPETQCNSSITSAELAKRYFRNGIEISPVRPYELEALSGKGWPLLIETIPTLTHRWGEEATEKLVTFDPSDITGHFLTWADKAHRKNLLLISSYPRNLLIKGLVPKWWPDSATSLTLLTAWQDVMSISVAELLNKVHVLNESEQDILSRIADAELGTNKYLLHPLHKSLTLARKDLIPLYRKASYQSLGPNDIYELGVNLDLLAAMLKDNKTYNDYQALRVKRSIARAQNILDVWSQMLYVFEYKPKDIGYPRVESSFTKRNKQEELYDYY